MLLVIFHFHAKFHFFEKIIGNIFLGYLDGRASFDDANEHWEDLLGPLILFHRSFDETTKHDKELAKEIRELYFGQENISKDTMKEMIKLSGDHMFYGGTEMIVRQFAKTNTYDTFRYMYSHKGTFTLVDVFLLNKVVFLGKLLAAYTTGYKIVDLDMGVCHSDELFVLFNPHALPFNSLFTKEDKRASQRMLNYFVNFAT